MAKDRLITPSYCFILAANFLLYFGFWLLIPVLPFYLSEFFQAGTSIIGIVLSCYTVAALCIRPFSGYLLDTFARKPLYLFAYFIFMMMFGGYLIAGSLTLFIIFRIIHGVSFGMVTVGGNTIVIDIMPSSRRGEGLGTGEKTEWSVIDVPVRYCGEQTAFEFGFAEGNITKSVGCDLSRSGFTVCAEG